jgi:hypothetical protein
MGMATRPHAGVGFFPRAGRAGATPLVEERRTERSADPSQHAAVVESGCWRPKTDRFGGICAMSVYDPQRYLVRHAWATTVRLASAFDQAHSIGQ